MRLTVQSFLLNKRLSFSVEASDKECSCQCRRHKKCRFDPWAGRISWKREWLPLQYSCLENSMSRGAWWATVYGVAKSPTQLKLPSTQTIIGIQSAPHLLNFTTTSLKASLHVRLSYQGKKKKKSRHIKRQQTQFKDIRTNIKVRHGKYIGDVRTGI